MQVLETFKGFVERIDGDLAYITLTAQSGEVFWCEYSAKELAKVGIRERRSFICQIIKVDDKVDVDLQAIPDRIISPEEEETIARHLHEMLGDD